MTPEMQLVTKPPDFTADDFNTRKPYEWLFLTATPNTFEFECAKNALEARAEGVGFGKFSKMFKSYSKTLPPANSLVLGTTEFSEQQIELKCGAWECTDRGVERPGKNGGTEKACSHPIMPVERLVNLDTGETKYRLAFNRGDKWRDLIISAADMAQSKAIVAPLAAAGVSITSATAPALVAFLNEVCDLNYERIPCKKSISRMGYIPGEGFSPYVEGLVFDGEAAFRALYDSVKPAGSADEWFRIAGACREESIAARVLLAASFASPILSIVGSLPFFVHLWGVDSGTGKTVGLMLAASVWGDPQKGKYMQTFNATQVGQERSAAFLNHLPLCVDELQLTKDAKGKPVFDVYQLAEGVGRARGRKSGGVEILPTWDCCILTTGESPIVSGNAGAGAVNRVIDIECTAGEPVIRDGHGVANALRKNYGYAGEAFVKKLYSGPEVTEFVAEIFGDFLQDLNKRNASTGKQNMAAAAILTADFLAKHWLFDEDAVPLEVDDIAPFLATGAEVSAGQRAYDWLCGWVAVNRNRFYIKGEEPPIGEVYGSFVDAETVNVAKVIFERELSAKGFDCKGVLSWLQKQRLIDSRGSKGYYRSKSIAGVVQQCIVLRLNVPNWVNECDEPEEMLPL